MTKLGHQTAQAEAESSITELRAAHAIELENIKREAFISQAGLSVSWSQFSGTLSQSRQRTETQRQRRKLERQQHLKSWLQKWNLMRRQ